VKYGATVLTISSTVDWDLYAVGTSSAALGGVNIWDTLVSYGTRSTNATTRLPLSLLELHQYPGNPSFGTVDTSGTSASAYDYGRVFSQDTVTFNGVGQNSIYYSGTPYTLPAIGEKYIAGQADPADFVQGGSYLTQASSGTSNYRYVIDYRIWPGLPVVFPMAGDNHGVSESLNTAVAGTYAQPGIYSMNVKYILAENQ
jgi:hypothetical protein